MPVSSASEGCLRARRYGNREGSKPRFPEVIKTLTGAESSRRATGHQQRHVWHAVSTGWKATARCAGSRVAAVEMVAVGLALGLAAGVSPGPLMVLVITQALRGGWRAGVVTAAAP